MEIGQTFHLGTRRVCPADGQGDTSRGTKLVTMAVCGSGAHTVRSNGKFAWGLCKVVPVDLRHNLKWFTSIPWVENPPMIDPYFRGYWAGMIISHAKVPLSHMEVCLNWQQWPKKTARRTSCKQFWWSKVTPLSFFEYVETRAILKGIGPYPET